MIHMKISTLGGFGLSVKKKKKKILFISYSFVPNFATCTHLKFSLNCQIAARLFALFPVKLRSDDVALRVHYYCLSASRNKVALSC